MSREGEDRRVSIIFFNAVVQAVLLFRAKTWVLTPRIERALESFMHRAAHSRHVRDIVIILEEGNLPHPR